MSLYRRRVQSSATTPHLPAQTLNILYLLNQQSALQEHSTIHTHLTTIIGACHTSSIMARESQRSSSSSSASSIFMRGPFTRSTTSPPSLNRQNSHTARQECSVSPQGGASSLLFKVASASFRTSPRSSPPASPRQCPVDVQEVQWDVLSRRLSENRHGKQI
jgi:hypothetical protein